MSSKSNRTANGSIFRAFFVLAVFVIGVVSGIVLHGPILARLNNLKPVSQDLPEDLDYSEVEQVYDSLRTNFDGELKLEDLIVGLKEGIVEASGDPFTEFLDAEETKSFDEELTGKFTGIGAVLSKDENSIVVVSPLAGFPAQDAGVRSKDIIAEIDGESAFDISVTEAVNKIRGPEGTEVKLRIIRGEAEEIELTITRAEITIPSVESEILEGNIGYMQISRFGTDTTRLARNIATDFRNSGVRGIILDLRGNPGGLLDSSVELASLWVEAGKPVVEQKRANATLKTLDAEGEAILNGIPTVVLINEGSASASEIVAGALKDHNLATLVGGKTYGKGSVQQLVDFDDGTKLKVTIARWFTPGGSNIDHEGIEPDHQIERTEEDFEADRDPQKDMALELLL